MIVVALTAATPRQNHPAWSPPISCESETSPHAQCPSPAPAQARPNAHPHAPTYPPSKA